MIDKYLTEDEIGSQFLMGAMSVGLEKMAGIFDIIGGSKDVVVDSAKLLGWLIGSGAATGAASGVMYNLAKNRLSADAAEKEDETNKKTSLYIAKNKELDDVRWLGRARGVRADIMRNMKNMTPAEYKKKYEELSRILDERSNV